MTVTQRKQISFPIDLRDRIRARARSEHRSMTQLLYLMIEDRENAAIVANAIAAAEKELLCQTTAKS